MNDKTSNVTKNDVDKLICLPLHSKISQSYMDRLINKINQYHSKLLVN